MFEIQGFQNAGYNDTLYFRFRGLEVQVYNDILSLCEVCIFDDLQYVENIFFCLIVMIKSHVSRL